jgi:hypothetical protein
VNRDNLRLRQRIQSSIYGLCGTAALLLFGGNLREAQAQNAPPTTQNPPLLQTKFIEDVQGWTAFGDKTKVELASDGARKVLRFDYNVAKGNFTALNLPVNENEITTAKSFRFTIKADTATTIACVLQEADGGRYVAFFHVPDNKWQNVTLAPSDFLLTEGPDDPKDPNNKLDLDRVNGFAITDVMQFLAQSDEPGIEAIFPVKRGARYLLMGDFSIGADALPGAAFLVKSDARLDTFGHPQIGWLAIGETQLSLNSGKPLGTRGLKAVYTQGTGKVGGFLRGVPRGRLEGREKMTFTLASAKPIRLVVQLEERTGGKYDAIIEVSGGETPKEYTVNFADLKPTADSKDNNSKLDLDQVYQIVFLDASGIIGQVEAGENTLYLGTLRSPLVGQ